MIVKNIFGGFNLEEHNDPKNSIKLFTNSIKLDTKANGDEFNESKSKSVEVTRLDSQNRC